MSWKLQNNGKLQNNTVNRTMSITINHVIMIVICNSIKVWIQKRQLQNLWETSMNVDVLFIISPFILLGKILLPYVILIYYSPAYYNSDEMLTGLSMLIKSFMKIHWIVLKSWRRIKKFVLVFSFRFDAIWGIELQMSQWRLL